MASDKKASEKTVALKVRASLEGALPSDGEPEVAAFAFSAGGQLIAHAPLEAAGAVLEVPARDEVQAVRVVVGPLASAESDAALADLFRLNAAEQTIRLEGKAPAATEFEIPREVWLCWLFGRCTVRGRMLKREQIGGVEIDMSVCGAEVEIYEVDAIEILIPRIPLELLERLREVVRFPPPPPPPPEETIFGVRPQEQAPELGAVRELLAVTQASVIRSSSVTPGAVVTRSELAQERVAEPKGAGDTTSPTRTVALAPEPPVAPGLDEAEGAVRALAGSSEVALAADQGLAAFRSALVANEELVRPVFCIFFPWLITKQLVATTTTDECGRFRATFWRGCTSGKTNLYFEAFRRILFFRVPIYQPTPIVCHTYWGYACGTEVTLYTSSPLAPTCPPCRPIIAPPHWVAVMAIGNTPLSLIHGTSKALTTTVDNVGLTSTGAPFGGTLRARLEFDNALRDELGVQYYKVSWRAAGTGNPWVPLDSEIHRHYSHVVGSAIVFEAYSLGPRVVGGEAALFEIPPALPPTGQWAIVDAVEDVASAKFPTGGSQPATSGLVPPGHEGIYELRVELFDVAGAPIALDTDGITFVVPTSTDLVNTVYTAEAAELGLIEGNAFVMPLHIDNNPTSAVIEPPLLNGSTPPNANCGVIGYNHPHSDTVTIAYQASHPHGFARYQFTLDRGVTTLTPPSAGGPVQPGTISSNESVGYLLDHCDVAGFAEELRVEGTATDGWSRCGYDTHDLRAFVLKPS